MSWMKRCVGWMLVTLVVGCPVDEVAVDASVLDAPVCACDDGISCTRDFCDALGACVHVADCENGWCAVLPDGNARCETLACAGPSDCRGDLPCAELYGCVDGFCRYDWAVDRDGDGERDRGCGGNDCRPADPAFPRAELCNGIDDDCDWVTDNNVDVSSDPANCGECGRRCDSVCSAGVCLCNAPFEMCGLGCAHLEADPDNCGACGRECVSRSCEAGVCTEAPAFYGVDRPAFVRDGAPRLSVSPNGDTVFEVVLRPTVVLSADRPPLAIAAGASPFPLHVVRLDRAGALLSVTSLPQVDASEMLVSTDGGFYFAGTTERTFELEGQRFLPGVIVVGFVRRGTDNVAWVHSLSGHRIVVMRALPSGALALVVEGMGEPGFRDGESNALRVIASDGVVTSLPAPTELGVYDGTTTLIRSGDGFMAFPTAPIDSLPIVGPPTGGYLALRHDALGRRVEAVRIPGSWLFRERGDGSAWLAFGDSGLLEVTRTSSRRLFYFGGYSANVVEYDESGVIFAPGVSRVRGSEVRATLRTNGYTADIANGAVWTIAVDDPLYPTLPGARTVIARYDLRPLP